MIQKDLFHLSYTTYPYDDLDIKFKRNRFALLIDMYLKFQHSYYRRTPQVPHSNRPNTAAYSTYP